jgi:hypothetical protein
MRTLPRARSAVEDGAHGAAPQLRHDVGDQAVEERLGRRFAGRAVADATGRIDPDEVVGAEGRLVLAAGGDQQFERVAGEDHAVVARGAERPVAGVKLAADGPQLVDGAGGGIERGG